MGLENVSAEWRPSPIDIATLSTEKPKDVGRFLTLRKNHKATPLRSLSALPRELSVSTIVVKESIRWYERRLASHLADLNRDIVLRRAADPEYWFSLNRNKFRSQLPLT